MPLSSECMQLVGPNHNAHFGPRQYLAISCMTAGHDHRHNLTLILSERDQICAFAAHLIAAAQTPSRTKKPQRDARAANAGAATAPHASLPTKSTDPSSKKRNLP